MCLSLTQRATQRYGLPRQLYFSTHESTVLAVSIPGPDFLPQVAYCQGMNFVCAAIFLVVEDEPSAFWLLSFIVEEVLVDHFVQSMIGHQVATHAEQLGTSTHASLLTHLAGVFSQPSHPAL